jgi:hypothetical protein
MKLQHLLEMNPRDIPGPGDYHPGDEYLPGSPDYDPSAGRRRTRSGGYSQAERDADWDADQRAQENRRLQREQQHKAKIADVKYDEEYRHGRQYAPVTIYTGVAADEATAQREGSRIRYVAYHFYKADIKPRDDGRFDFRFEYMM